MQLRARSRSAIAQLKARKCCVDGLASHSVARSSEVDQSSSRSQPPLDSKTVVFDSKTVVYRAHHVARLAHAGQKKRQGATKQTQRRRCSAQKGQTKQRVGRPSRQGRVPQSVPRGNVDL